MAFVDTLFVSTKRAWWTDRIKHYIESGMSKEAASQSQGAVAQLFRNALQFQDCCVTDLFLTTYN